MSLPRTPDVLQCLIEGFTREELARKPAPDRFSIAEVIAHLHHVEEHCYGVRLRQFVSESTPVLAAYDVDLHNAEGTYSGKDGFVELTEFEIARRRNLEILAGIPGDRTATHQRLGTVTLDNMLAEWACHDLAHVRQVAELVRWVRHQPLLGPWEAEYTIRP